jgi:hypothetical protein
VEPSLYYIIGVAFAVLAGVWKIFQTQLDSILKRLDKLEASLVGRQEHVEFGRRIDGKFSTIEAQLRVLEETRPTTGELEAVATGNAAQITKLEDRVGKLESAKRAT